MKLFIAILLTVFLTGCATVSTPTVQETPEETLEKTDTYIPWWVDR